MGEETPRIRCFERIPSSEEFASQIETKNVPAVINGCIKDWKAFCKWNPCNEGLDYLQGRVGSSTVEAMLSRSAPVFYGDIRSHERVPLPFSTFIEFCKELMKNSKDGQRSNPETLLGFEDAQQQIYLAQVPIINIENGERVQLESLKDDIQTPSFLKTKRIASVNLWMNSNQSRSSTHYDPHHNLLCIVAGSKQVALYPPSASSVLYPLPLYGEASNHSAVALEKPDLSVHPRAAHSVDFSQKVTLHAGDALFIPEGWYHQVDSDVLTIAINFWWRSNILSEMSEHMDVYYLRRILKRLADKEMVRYFFDNREFEIRNAQELSNFLCNFNQIPWQNQMLCAAGVNEIVTTRFSNPIDGKADQIDNICDQDYLTKDSKGKKLKKAIMLHELEPLALQSLHELTSLVHQNVNVLNLSEEVDFPSPNNSGVKEKDELEKNLKTDYFLLQDDPVANIIWTVHPLTLQTVLLAMAHNFPRTLEALVFHSLSPVGAEVLTRKFEEMDQLTDEADRNEFYRIFYGVFDNQFYAMDAILNGKESFARQAFKNVLEQNLGIKFDGSDPSV